LLSPSLPSSCWELALSPVFEACAQAGEGFNRRPASFPG
jgi:hypothetical protein